MTLSAQNPKADGFDGYRFRRLLTRMYGPTVCCKSYFEIAVLVMRKCIRPRCGTFSSGPSWLSAHIKSH